jgi:hypothetical protein
MSESVLNDLDVTIVLADIESGNFTSKEIMSKYDLSSYKYYKILEEYGVKNPSMKTGPKGSFGPVGPKNTPFKKLLSKSNEPDPDPSSFNLEEFRKDCEKSMKIVELMDKHSLSLYQVRELRKKYDLKTK